jgi:hypothetical protein
LGRIVHRSGRLSELFHGFAEVVRRFLFANRGAGGIGLDIVCSRLHAVRHTIGLHRIRSGSCCRRRLGILCIPSCVLQILLCGSGLILQISFSLAERLKCLLPLR